MGNIYAHLKFTVYGRKQTDVHTRLTMQSCASVSEPQSCGYIQLSHPTFMAWHCIQIQFEPAEVISSKWPGTRLIIVMITVWMMLALPSSLSPFSSPTTSFPPSSFYPIPLTLDISVHNPSVMDDKHSCQQVFSVVSYHVLCQSPPSYT